MSASQRVSRGVYQLAIYIAVHAMLAIATARATEFLGLVGKVVDGDTLWVCDANACMTSP